MIELEQGDVMSCIFNLCLRSNVRYVFEGEVHYITQN